LSTLSLHDALPIYPTDGVPLRASKERPGGARCIKYMCEKRGVSRSGAPQMLARLAHLAIERRLARRAVRCAGLRALGGGRRRRRRRCRRAHKGLLERAIGVHELLAQLIGRLAQVADDTADVAHHLRHPLGTEDEEGDDRDEEQLLGPDAEHQRRSVAIARAAFALSRSARAASAAARS